MVLVVDLQLRDFRSYERASARLGSGLNVIHGANGVGKSNLLEALYFGCTGRSSRTRSERELVRFGAESTRVVVGVVDGSREHRIAVGFKPGEPKRMTVDGALVEKVSEVSQRPLLSVFSPERLELLKGPPALRRSHLDQLVAAVWPVRAAARHEYSRVLAQRNALIAGIRFGRASRSTLSSWDSELARNALELRESRMAAVSLMSEDFSQLASRLGLRGNSLLRYRPRSEAGDVEAFLAELRERLPSDLERGFSTFGPHRDELAFTRDGRELRTYGSQGEQRLALLALLLAERRLLARERDGVPLMLLDDVMSELDAARRELLASELRDGGQSLVATTDLAHVPGAEDRAVTRLGISAGTILQEAKAA